MSRISVDNRISLPTKPKQSQIKDDFYHPYLLQGYISRYEDLYLILYLQCVFARLKGELVRLARLLTPLSW